VSGTTTTIDALKVIHGAGMAFAPYWHMEVVPALQRGFRPPLADGFRHFVTAPDIATNVATALETEIADGKVDPYDTHPPLRERILALEAVPVGNGVTNDDASLAISLIDDVAALELALVDGIVRDEFRGKLAPLTWEDAGANRPTCSGQRWPLGFTRAGSLSVPCPVTPCCSSAMTCRSRPSTR